MEMEKFNYMLAIDILRNLSQKMLMIYKRLPRHPIGKDWREGKYCLPNFILNPPEVTSVSINLEIMITGDHPGTMNCAQC